MFKVGDIVRLSDIGKDVYKSKLYRQTYEVIWAHEKWGIIVKGFTNGLEIVCYSNQIVKIDTDYLRKHKIDKIYSKICHI